MNSSRAQLGIALAAVLLVLLVVSAVVAAVFFAALQESRLGRNTILARRALDAAEAGLDEARWRWSRGGLGRLDPTGWRAFSATLPGGTAAYEGTVQRLNGSLYLVRSTGHDRSGASRRTLAAVLRLAPFPLRFRAALSVGGAARMGLGALVDGASADSGGGACADADRAAAGLLLRDPGALDPGGCVPDGCVRGTPTVLADSALAAGDPPGVDDGSWATLVGLADTVTASGLASPPQGPTVVYAPADLRAEGGTISGVVLVAGNLVLAGGVRIDGVVLVRGRLTAQGAGGVLRGAAASREVDFGDPSAVFTAVYSPCQVDRALRLAGSARLLPERGWGELF